jgi:hypothetical protein
MAYRHQPETIGVNLRLSTPTWHYRRQSKTIGTNLRLSASIWDYRHQPETIGVNLRLSAPTWDYRRQSETIGTNLRLSASIWDYRHQPETIGVNLRLSGPIWDYRRHPRGHLGLNPRSTEFNGQGQLSSAAKATQQRKGANSEYAHFRQKDYISSAPHGESSVSFQSSPEQHLFYRTHCYPGEGATW